MKPIKSLEEFEKQWARGNKQILLLVIGIAIVLFIGFLVHP